MIKLSNGYGFEYLAASGALGYDGKGWLHERLLGAIGWINFPYELVRITKTLTPKPNRGNGKIKTIRLIKQGAVNAMALPNPGVLWWCQKIGPKIDSAKILLFISLHSSNPKEFGEMAKTTSRFDLVGTEINVSCPNIYSPNDYDPIQIIKICEETKKKSNLPVLLKLSVTHEPYLDIFLPKLEGIVEAININTVPWSIVFPVTKSPLHKFGGGGVSGKPAQKFNWPFMKKLIDKTDIPVIAPSIWNFKDIATVRALGAKAIAFGSLFFRPWLPPRFIEQDMAENSH